MTYTRIYERAEIEAPTGAIIEAIIDSEIYPLDQCGIEPHTVRAEGYIYIEDFSGTGYALGFDVDFWKGEKGEVRFEFDTDPYEWSFYAPLGCQESEFDFEAVCRAAGGEVVLSRDLIPAALRAVCVVASKRAGAFIEQCEREGAF